MEGPRTAHGTQGEAAPTGLSPLLTSWLCLMMCLPWPLQGTRTCTAAAQQPPVYRRLLRIALKVERSHSCWNTRGKWRKWVHVLRVRNVGNAPFCLSKECQIILKSCQAIKTRNSDSVLYEERGLEHKNCIFVRSLTPCLGEVKLQRSLLLGKGSPLFRETSLQDTTG